MPLTDADKAVILAEERYRQEVRDQLAEEAPPKSASERAWKLLNSGLGIWLLSTVVVGLAGWAYSRWSAAADARADRAHRIQVLDSEIGFRLRQLRGTFPSNPTPVSMVASGLITFRSSLPISAGDTQVSASGMQPAGLYADLASRDLFGLIWELQSLVTDEQRASLDEALVHAEALNAYAVQLLMVYTSDVSRLEDPVALFTPLPKMQTRLILERIDRLSGVERWQLADPDSGHLEDDSLLETMEEDAYAQWTRSIQRRVGPDRLAISAPETHVGSVVQIDAYSMELLDYSPDTDVALIRVTLETTLPYPDEFLVMDGAIAFKLWNEPVTETAESAVYVAGPPVEFQAVLSRMHDDGVINDYYSEFDVTLADLPDGIATLLSGQDYRWDAFGELYIRDLAPVSAEDAEALLEETLSSPNAETN